jgi:hypothetical protein
LTNRRFAIYGLRVFDTLSTVASRMHHDLGAILAAPVLDAARDPLQALRASVDVQRQAASLVDAAVAQARDAGSTWRDIGELLGISRQAAFQRFGRPIDPRTGKSMNTVPLPEAPILAVTVINALAQARWDDVVNRFDEQLRAALTSSALAAAWAQVVGMAGSYERHGDPQAMRAADITITNTPLAFEAGDFIARVSFRDDKTIAGLYILPDDTKGEP